jgi:GNAT superfamily N-acetyltransferase
MGSPRIRPLDPEAPSAPDEIALVARRMHLTLVEVLGEARARALYDDARLRDRVHWHLDPRPGRSAQVLLSEDGHGAITGHAIVRVETVDGRDVGLFGTTYVDPAHRRLGVASALLRAGEGWMRARGMAESVTFTDAANAPLQRLFERHGYAATRVEAGWVRLSRALRGEADRRTRSS